MKACSGEDHVDLRELHPPDRRVRTRGGGLRLLKNPKVVALFCGRCGYHKALRTGVVKMLGGKDGGDNCPSEGGRPKLDRRKSLSLRGPSGVPAAPLNPPSAVEIGDGGGALGNVKARRLTPHEAPGEARGTPRRISARGDQVGLEYFVEASQ